MTRIDAVIERLRRAYGRAEQKGPGNFRFVSSIAGLDDDLICAVVIVRNTEQALAALRDSFK